MTTGKPKQSWVPGVLIGIAVAYLFLVQYIPTINVFYQAFKNGIGPFFENLSRVDFLHAAWLTLLLAVISIPINTVFGLCAAW
ncbi:MAG: sulfate ABC transporter permease subunit CysW, partial [Sphaerospermopsis kisseleviana]